MKNLNLPPFYVGQKVVCVDNSNINCYTKAPSKEVIYTIREVYFGHSHRGRGWGLRLNEIVNIKNDYGSEWGYLVERFRTVEEQKFPLMTFSKIVETEKEEILIPN